jgi:nucleoside-diphosphate-sugar epimerase
MQAQRNIWILGGTGFIGTALTAHLRKNSLNRLQMLVHRNIPYRKLEDINIFAGGIEDIRPEWLINYPPDVVFHLARPAGSYYITRKLAARKAGRGNRHLFNLLHNLPKPPIVVYVSGSLMYGPQDMGRFANEETSLNPKSFARYYIEGERIWLEAQKKGLLDVRFARPAWILGPASWFREFYWKFFLLNRKVPVFGNGMQEMSLIHLDDCARMIDQLSTHGSVGNNLNIFSGPAVTQLEFSRHIIANLGAEIQYVSKNTLERKYGKTTASALLESIPLKTRYPELYEHSELLFPDIDSMIKHTLALLENEKSIFAKAP